MSTGQINTLVDSEGNFKIVEEDEAPREPSVFFKIMDTWEKGK